MVAGMYDELGLGELIDSLIPQDEDQRIVSVGQSVRAMVLNVLGFANQGLVLTSAILLKQPASSGQYTYFAVLFSL
ncbi:MAG: DUF4277 domain-containing protein [Candidatus Electrothrix sp. AR1]|nr:DUF4277 domain-containing protein [Candidatus Electrothrix sp. AR1]